MIHNEEQQGAHEPTHIPVLYEERKHEKEKKQSFLGIGLAILLATATFFSGLHIGNDTRLEANIFSFLSRETKADDSVDLTEFWHVWNLLDEKFVKTSTSTLI